MQLSKNKTPPAAGQTWLGTDIPTGELFDAPDQAKGWLTAFDAETGWKNPMPRPILAGVTPTADTGQSTGGGIVTYTAGGRQLIGVASG